MRNGGRQPGAATIETVLVLPLVFVLLSLMFYFGRGFVRVEHAVTAGRYEAWRRAEHAPGPRADHLNELFFGGRASGIELDVDGAFPRDARDRLVELSGGVLPDAGRYADELFGQMPGGVTARLTVRHDEANDFWEEIDGPIRERSVRIGNDWRLANGLRYDEGRGRWLPAGPGVNNARVVRDVFLADLDERLEALADREVGLAGTLRGFYLATPGYVGPDLPEDWLEDAAP